MGKTSTEADSDLFRAEGPGEGINVGKAGKRSGHDCWRLSMPKLTP